MMPVSRSIEERLWEKVDKRGNEDCWPWTACRDALGYGMIGWPRDDHPKTGMWRAHRVVWTLINGEIPNGMCVCHSCDNPPCCNPSHLFVGTHQENMADMKEKGRAKSGTRFMSRKKLLATRVRGGRHPMRTNPELSYFHGESNPKAKLSEDQVREIRNLVGETGTSVAKRYGISISAACRILRKDSWEHVD